MVRRLTLTGDAELRLLELMEYEDYDEATRLVDDLVTDRLDAAKEAEREREQAAKEERERREWIDDHPVTEFFGFGYVQERVRAQVNCYPDPETYLPHVEQYTYDALNLLIDVQACAEQNETVSQKLSTSPNRIAALVDTSGDPVAFVTSVYHPNVSLEYDYGKVVGHSVWDIYADTVPEGFDPTPVRGEGRLLTVVNTEAIDAEPLPSATPQYALTDLVQ